MSPEDICSQSVTLTIPGIVFMVVCGGLVLACAVATIRKVLSTPRKADQG